MQDSDDIRALRRDMDLFLEEAERLNKRLSIFLDGAENLDDRLTALEATAPLSSEPTKIITSTMPPVASETTTPTALELVASGPPPVPEDALVRLAREGMESTSRGQDIPMRPSAWEHPEPSAVLEERSNLAQAAKRYSAPAPFPQKPLRDRILEKMRKAAGAGPDAGWEVLLGAYLLPRIAILLLAIATVFFMSKAIHEYGNLWTPPMRVATGYIVCAIFLAFGQRLEARYPLYARVLFAGGFALSYLVSFATHYLPFSRVFDSPAPSLLLLGAVTLIWAAAAQWRRSKVMAAMVTGLAHATILLATLTLDSPETHEVTALLALACGSAFFLLRNRWYHVAAMGIVGAYLNYAVWLLKRAPSGDPWDYALAMGVLVAFLLIFALAELFSHESLRRKIVPIWFRTLYVTANSASFFSLGIYLTMSFPGISPYVDMFEFAYSALLGAIALGYIIHRARDPLHNVYLTKAVAVFTLALATRYDSDALTAWLAVETVALLASSRRSGFVVTRVLAIGVAIVTLVYSLSQMVGAHPTEEAFRQAFASETVAALAMFAASVLYIHTDWSSRSPRFLPVHPNNGFLLWQLDLVAEKPEGTTGEKPLWGMLFPYLYAIAATVVTLTAIYRLASGAEQGMTAAALLGLLVAGAAWLAKSPPLGFSALCVSFATFIPMLVLTARTLKTAMRAEIPDELVTLLTPGMIAVASFVVMTELVRRALLVIPKTALPYFPTLGWMELPEPCPRSPLLPHILAHAAIAALALTIVRYMPVPWLVASFCIGAVVLTALARLAGSLPFGVAALTAAALGALSPIPIWGELTATPLTVAVIGMIIVALASERHPLLAGDGLLCHRMAASPYALYLAAIWMFCLRMQIMPGSVPGICGVITAVIVCAALTMVLNPHALAVAMTFAYIWACDSWWEYNNSMQPATMHALAWGLIILGFALERFHVWRSQSMPMPRFIQLQPVLLFGAWAVASCYFPIALPDSLAPCAPAFVSAAFLTYAVFLHLAPPAAFAIIGAFFSTFWQLLHTSDPIQVNTGGVVFACVLLVIFWIVCERLANRLVSSNRIYQGAMIASVILAAALTVSTTYRLPFLKDNWLTLAWGVGALVFFGVALGFGQKLYRYAGLALIGLALLRVPKAILDLEGLYRVGAIAGLGIVLLGLAFGYVKAIELLRKGAPPLTESSDNPPHDTD